MKNEVFNCHSDFQCSYTQVPLGKYWVKGCPSYFDMYMVSLPVFNNKDSLLIELRENSLPITMGYLCCMFFKTTLNKENNAEVDSNELKSPLGY